MIWHEKTRVHIRFLASEVRRKGYNLQVLEKHLLSVVSVDNIHLQLQFFEKAEKDN